MDPKPKYFLALPSLWPVTVWFGAAAWWMQYRGLAFLQHCLKLSLLPAGCTSKSLTRAPNTKFFFTELFVAKMRSVVLNGLLYFFNKESRGAVVIFSSVFLTTQLVRLRLISSCLSWSLSFRRTAGLDYCVVHVLISSLKDQPLIKFGDLYIKPLGSLPDQHISGLG